MMLTKKEDSTESGILNSWEVHEGSDSEVLGCHNLPSEAPSYSNPRHGIDRILLKGPEIWSPTPVGKKEENFDTEWPHRSQKSSLYGLEGDVSYEVQSIELDEEEDFSRTTDSIQGLVRAKDFSDLVAAQFPSLTPSVCNQGELDLEGKPTPSIMYVQSPSWVYETRHILERRK